MEQRSKAWEDEASFDKSPRNTFSFNLFNKYFKGLEHHLPPPIFLRTPCCNFFLVISLLFIFNQVLPISQI